MFPQQAHIPDKAARIVARSFYRELRKAGFETKDILLVTAEILDNLNEAFRRIPAQHRETVTVEESA